MDNLLAGLDKLGLNVDKIGSLYEEEVTENVVEESKPIVFNEEDYIFDKTINCPVCGKSFKNKVVRTGRARLVSSDTDLKPIYSGFEPLKYDVFACPACGYAATSKNFVHISQSQIRMVKENISKGFKGIQPSGSTYTFQEALERYKLALANAIVIKAKNSERAYLCLKMAWLYRSMHSGLPEGDSMIEKMRIEFIELEKSFLKSAYDGFKTSYSKEIPPICGMDIDTLTYLLAELARRCGDYENSRAFLSTVLNTRTVSPKVRERARNLREVLSKEMNGRDNEE